MKILIISTSDSGGAYVSAERLANGLKEFGHDAMLITRSNYQGIRYEELTKFSSKVVTLLSKILARKPFEQIAPISVPFINLSDIKDLNPDLIHIHNWYNFLSISQLEKLIQQYPVVFTMHDARLLTGGCFFTFDCDGFSKGCKHCPAIFFPKLLIRSSKNKLAEVINMSRPHRVITPSYWMQSQFKTTYPDIRATAHQVIPNMPNKIFMHSKPGISQRLGNRKTLLFVASDITQPLKGLKLLLEAVGSFRDLVTLNIVGSGEIELSSESQKYINLLGNLTERELRKQFEISDALIVPSLSENRPNVIIEAQLSGVFVIATDVGGIPEMILEGKTGILCRPNKGNLAEAIASYLEMTEETKFDIKGRALIKAREINNPAKIIEAHVDLYVELMNEYCQGQSGATQK